VNPYRSSVSNEIAEWTTLTLEEELLDHLASTESVARLYPKFTGEYLLDDEPLARSVLEYQWDHIRQYGEPATKDALEYAFVDIQFTEPSTNVEWLADQFRQRYISNNAKKATVEIASKIAKDPKAGIELAVTRFGELKNHTRSTPIQVTTRDFKPILDEFFERKMEDAVSFGHAAMDEHLIGMIKGHMYTVIGRPKCFKSWKLLLSAIACQGQGKKAVFFSLEMPKEEMFYRYACLATGISWNRFYHHRLTGPEKKELYDALDFLSGQQNPLVILQPPVGERKVSDLKALARDLGADAVYVDQISFIKSTRQYPGRHLEVEEICEEVKADAVMDFPWFIACQFNREAANLTEMADLAKIGLSDAIGQKSDVILGLHVTKEMRESHAFQYGVVEARSFAPRIWEVNYDLQNTAAFRVTGESE
jgi:replicative DNA helicase